MRVLAVLLLLAGPARAGDTIVFADAGATVTHDCGAHPKVAITGARNAITLSGACARVAVHGTGNTVAIASAAVVAVTGSSNRVTVDTAAKIAVSGTQNRVAWRTGKKPRVSAAGIGNAIVQAPP